MTLQLPDVEREYAVALMRLQAAEFKTLEAQDAYHRLLGQFMGTDRPPTRAQESTLADAHATMLDALINQGREASRVEAAELKISIAKGRIVRAAEGGAETTRLADAARPTIVLSPGHRFAGALRRLFGPRVFERVFGQTMADAHDEWVEATIAGDDGEARALHWRTPARLFWVAFVVALHWLAKRAKIVGGIFKSAGD